MRNILVINGPNLNMLGIREPDIYGSKTYKDLKDMIYKHCEELGVKAIIEQWNGEGEIVSAIQRARLTMNPAPIGIVINPAAYTHTSIAILDALKAVGIRTVEVHISDVDSREDFRKVSYVSCYAEKKITGHGLEGYIEAIDYLLETKE